jgi:type I restriction enzyme R subunit
MQPARLYESPFTDLTPRGPDYLFEPVELDALLNTLEAVRATAMAA